MCFFYFSSNESQKDQLIPSIITALEQGKHIERIHEIYFASNQEQKKKLFPPIVHTLFGYPLDITTKTQTGAHLFKYFDLVCKDVQVQENLFRDSKLKQMVTQIIQSEAGYIERGYYVFYHAQIWEIFLQEFIYTTLSSIKHQQKITDYFFTRFTKDGTCSENAVLLKEQRDIRKKLMKQGRFDPHRPSLLFLNYALFGNTTNGGSSSFHYGVNNSNVSNPDIKTRDVFEKFGLEDFYDSNK